MIDLSTDLVTEPTEAMWDAMRRAPFGLSSRGEAPAVTALEERAAALLGTEAALLVATGSLANLLALFTLPGRGEQVILEADAHSLWSEEWGLSTVCGLLARPLPGRAGALDPAEVEDAITASRFGHRPRTGLLCLENTHNAAGGAVMDPSQMAAICDVAHRHGVPVHLDGARIFNAAVALGRDVRELTRAADSVACSLNKGLSAPMGSLLCGSRAFVDRARRHAAVLGVGSLNLWSVAAAGLVALDEMIDRLAEDHRRARALAQGLAAVAELRVDVAGVRTNIVMVDVAGSGIDGRTFLERLAARGVWASHRAGSVLRFVTHRHITDEDVTRVIHTVAQLADDSKRTWAGASAQQRRTS
jgi:threonine aldolase